MTFKEELEEIVLNEASATCNDAELDKALTSIINLVDKSLPEHTTWDQSEAYTNPDTVQGYNEALDDMRAIIRGNDD